MSHIIVKLVPRECISVGHVTKQNTHHSRRNFTLHRSIHYPLSFVLSFEVLQKSRIHDCQETSWLHDLGLVHIFEITERTIIVKTQTYYNLVENKPMNWIVTSLLSPWNRCETSRTHVIERAETTWLDFISTVDLKSLILFAREN